MPSDHATPRTPNPDQPTPALTTEELQLARHAPNDPRRCLAILCGELTPYRVHWHQRVSREIPEFKLATLIYPHREGVAWTFDRLPGLGVVRFEAARPEGFENLRIVRTEAAAPISAIDRVRLRARVLLAEWRMTNHLMHWLTVNQPAAVLCNGYYGIAFVRTIFWCWRNYVPCLLWADSNVHGDRVRGARRALKRIVVGSVLAMTSAMLPCGRNGIEFFKRFSRRTDRMFRVPLEPDYEQIASTPAGLVREVRERFALDPARKRLIVVCRLIPLKRIDTCIDAFAEIAERRPDWDLLIVGDGPERERLEARVPESVRSRVTWAGFITDQSIVNALYRNADVMVLPSEYEAWALVVNEAAASGLALVVSNVVGAAPELVHDGVNGRLFPPGDVAALVACLMDVTDPAHLERMKRASAEVLAAWRRIADPIDGLRRALLAGGVRLSAP